MLHIDDPEIRNLLLEGKFGLEKEGLRVLADASMAHTPNPLPGNSHVSMDFSEIPLIWTARRTSLLRSLRGTARMRQPTGSICQPATEGTK